MILLLPPPRPPRPPPSLSLSTYISLAMAYMSDGMKMSVQLAGFGKTFGRLAGGGSLFQVTYTNEDPAFNGYIAMTPDYPGVIVPINMTTLSGARARNGSQAAIIAMRDSFLCATVGMDTSTGMTDVGAGFNPAQSVQGFCCSGIDFIVQTLTNGEWAFLMAMGTVVQRSLADGEKILVDTDSVLCFESSVAIDVQWIGSFKTCLCSGEVRRHEGTKNDLCVRLARCCFSCKSLDTIPTSWSLSCCVLLRPLLVFESHRVSVRRP
jgi:uncharacterized protein (AIM24 family)